MRLIAGIAVALVALTGCSETVANPGEGTGSDDAQYSEWSSGQRDAVTIDTTLADGTPLTNATLAGKIVVVNFWYAGCAPCRVEAPILEKVHQQYPDVEFVGVNTRDSAAEVDAFDAKFGVTYPSVLDAEQGDMLLAFAGKKPANTTPTTFVLDGNGGIAARVLGQLEDASILSTYIDDVEKDPGT